MSRLRGGLTAGGGVGAAFGLLVLAATLAAVLPSMHSLPALPRPISPDYSRDRIRPIKPLSDEFFGGGRAGTATADPSLSGRPRVVSGPDASPIVHRIRGSTPPGANDSVATATILPGAPYTDRTETSTATREPDEPMPCGEADRTVWYRYRAPRDQLLLVSTFGSNYDTMLAAYRGTELKPVHCNNNFAERRSASQVAVRAREGVTYFFQAGLAVSAAPTPGLVPNNSLLLFNLDAGRLPADRYADAWSIDALPFETKIHNAGATTDPDEPASCQVSIGNAPATISMTHTLWYRHVAARDGVLSVDTYASELDTVLAVYEGHTPDTLMGCSDDAVNRWSTVTLKVRRGAEYLIQVGARAGADPREVRLRVSSVLVPLHDAQSRAVRVAALPFLDKSPMFRTTIERSEPLGCLRPTRSIWYRYDAAERIVLSATAIGDGDASIAVFQLDGNRLSQLGCRGSGYDGPHVAFRTAPGRTYLFQIGERGEHSGFTTFHLHRAAPPDNDERTRARAVAGSASALAFVDRTSIYWATAEHNETPAGCAPTDATVWYRYQAPTAGVLSAKAAPDTGKARTADPVLIGYPTALAVYRQVAGGLQLLGCDDDGSAKGFSEVPFTVEPDEVYYVQAGRLASLKGRVRSGLCVEISAPRGGAGSSMPCRTAGNRMSGDRTSTSRPPTRQGGRWLRFSFDQDDEGFVRKSEQPFSDVAWNPAGRRIELRADRQDPDDELLAGALPSALTSNDDFTVTARWFATSQGNAQRAVPFYVSREIPASPAATYGAYLTEASSIAGIFYYARDSNVGDVPSYTMFFSSDGKRFASREVVLPTSTEYRFVLDYDAARRSMTMRIQSVGGFDIERAEWLLDGEDFSFSEIGVAAVGHHGVNDSTIEPVIEGWVDDFDVWHRGR